MIDPVDRLNDDFWTEDELHQMNIDVVNPSKYDRASKHMCWYHLTKDGEYTGIAMLLAVESIVDGQTAVNAMCTEIGLSAIIGEYSEEDIFTSRKVEAAYILLEKYSYNSQTEFIGSDKLFYYQDWMAKLC